MERLCAPVELDFLKKPEISILKVLLYGPKSKSRAAREIGKDPRTLDLVFEILKQKRMIKCKSGPRGDLWSFTLAGIAYLRQV